MRAWEPVFGKPRYATCSTQCNRVLVAADNDVTVSNCTALPIHSEARDLYIPKAAIDTLIVMDSC